MQTKLLSCTRNKPIRQEIGAFRRAAGYEDRDEDDCKTRIHPLVSAYRAYKRDFRNQNAMQPETSPEVICSKSASLRLLAAELRRVFFTSIGLHLQRFQKMRVVSAELDRIQFTFCTL